MFGCPQNLQVNSFQKNYPQDIRQTKFGFCPLLSYVHLGLTAKKYATKKMRFLKINEQSLEYLMQLKKIRYDFDSRFVVFTNGEQLPLHDDVFLGTEQATNRTLPPPPNKPIIKRYKGTRRIFVRKLEKLTKLALLNSLFM